MYLLVFVILVTIWVVYYSQWINILILVSIKQLF